MTFAENKFLPPFCKGKSSGNLKLTIKDIFFDPKNSTHLQILKVNVLWWGQEKGQDASINSSKKAEKIIEYQINTSPKLFQLYLKNCEPIQLNFFSLKGFVGSSKFVVDFCLEKSTFWVKKAKIYNSVNCIIGSLTLLIETQNITFANTKMKVSHKICSVRTINNVTTNHKSLISKKRIVSFNDPLGRSEKTVEHPNPEFTEHKNYDTIQVKILYTRISDIDQIDIASLQDKWFMKCAVTSKIFCDNDEIRILSSPLTSLQNGFYFSSDQNLCSRILKIPLGASVFLNFGISFQSRVRKSAAFVGFSRIDLQEVLRSNGFLNKTCPIVGENSIVGSVRVSVYIKPIRNLSEPVLRDVHNLINHMQNNISTQNLPTKSHPTSNESCKKENNAEMPMEHETSKDQVKGELGPDKFTSSDNQFDNKTSEGCFQVSSPQIYKGLLFIEELKNLKVISSNNFFMTYVGFWNDYNQENTQLSNDVIFNHLKEFLVNPDESFLKKVQNNHLELKLWENNNDEAEKFVASTRIPLHQFFIAFRDKAMIEHLSSNQLPIISFDTFANFVSPLSNANFCQGKVLLAIGTHTQIEHLKTVRDFRRLSSINTNLQKNTSSSNVVMKNKLAAFLESLSQKKDQSEKSSSSQELKGPPMQLKKTSDLLETLQQALLQPPKLNVLAEEKKCEVMLNQKKTDSESSTSSNLLEKRVKILVSIEHAAHLPKVTKKRKNRRNNKNNISLTEFEPSSYATFDTFDSDVESLKTDKKYLPECVIRSHEGLVYSTKVIKSVDPQWDECFDIQLPLDIIRSPQKRFVIKVWRKSTQECELKPAPFEDAVIGFTAVDLSVLLTGLTVLSGYYNITDFSGRCNGQIKLSFKPLESLVDYQCSSPTMSSLLDPLSIDMSMSNDSSLLSRTLKRKFSELDEITQRLKARLFDVTGNEDFDVDEEFERDLNTEVTDDDNNLIDFEWLKKDSEEEHMNFPIQASCSNNAMDNSSIPTQRMLTGCSNENSPFKDQLLWKKYDLDTLINPNIFKNILDPSICQSESTPSLNQHIKTVSPRDTSQATTVSSIDSNEMIIEALQQTHLTTSSERKTGDGGSNE